MKTHELTRLIGVLVLGFLIGTGITPLHAEDPVVVTGEILKVCIEAKTGVIRASTKCTKAERKTILGGVGTKGEKGDTGDVGFVGETGATGATGAVGGIGATGPTGAQGLTGERGLTGITGLQGIQGYTGATGSMSGLRTTTIQEWSKDLFSSCSTLFGISMLSSNTSLSQYSNTISLNKSCVSMSYKNVTVYAP